MDETTSSNDAAEKTRVMLARLWEQKRSSVEERVALLERAAAARPLNEELRLDAQDIAHKLAGSLGMFGFQEGTRIARELELLFENPAPDSAVLGDLTAQLREHLFPAS